MALLPAEAPPAPAELGPRLTGAVPRGMRRRTDERLVRAARDGDERAIEVLFERHASSILRYCRSLVRSGQEAEDVRQEVFVLAISALRRGAEPRAFRPWLYRIAHNACMTHLRARRPVLVADNGVLLEQQASEEPLDGPREELRQLLDDIAALPEVQRGALLLREMDGFSYEQVGEVLGVPQSTVRSSIFRARRTLQGLAEARDADCEAIQSELGELADRRGRRNRRITQHLRVCSACRAFRDELRRRPAVLGVDPGPALALGALAPLGGLVALKGKLFGGASAGAGAVVATSAGGGVTKVAAVASTCALLAAGGMEAERYLGEREQRPAAIPVEHGGTLPDAPTRGGAAAPASVAPATVAASAVPAIAAVPAAATGRLPAGEDRRADDPSGGGAPSEVPRDRRTVAAPPAAQDAPAHPIPQDAPPSVDRERPSATTGERTTARPRPRPTPAPPSEQRDPGRDDDDRPGDEAPRLPTPGQEQPGGKAPATPSDHAPAPDDEAPTGESAKPATGGPAAPSPAPAEEPSTTPSPSSPPASPDAPPAESPATPAEGSGGPAETPVATTGTSTTAP